MQLSVVIITFNEEANIGRTLASVQPLVAEGKGEIIVVDSGSTDRTVEIAKSYGAKVFIEEWKGFAAQKNSGINKAAGNYTLSLDADEEVSPELAQDIKTTVQTSNPCEKGLTNLRDRAPDGSSAPNYDQRLLHAAQELLPGTLDQAWRFLARPQDEALSPRHRQVQRRRRSRDCARSEYEKGGIHLVSGQLHGPLLHHSYPTLSDYIDHMNRYSSLGAQMVVAKGKVRFSVINIVLRPLFTFIYNYFFRLGFLDGREGLLLHLYHAVYVSWKYAKAWELSRKQNTMSS